MSMVEIATIVLILVGTFLMFVAGLGITRMPDLFLRMSATTKVSTLGMGAVMLAVVIYFDDLVATFHAIAIILFVFISAPVAAHVIGRAAYFTGVPLWEGTIVDELRGHYDIRTHQLESVPLPELEEHLPDVQVLKFRLSATSPLAGQTLAMIFEKSSTRTRVSFEVGMYQLGGLATFLSSRDIQIGRGEPIADTAQVLSRYVNGIMARTFAHSTVTELAAHATIPVINGLTDLLHPCQALTDYFTMREVFGHTRGLVLAYVGDGNNMCHSLMFGGPKCAWPRRRVTGLSRKSSSWPRPTPGLRVPPSSSSPAPKRGSAVPTWSTPMCGLPWARKQKPSSASPLLRASK